MYGKLLDPRIQLVKFSHLEMCWRLPILLHTHREQLRILHTLQSKGYLVSNHFFPVPPLFGESIPPNAREVGLRAVNFWIDEKVSIEAIRHICEEVNTTYDKAA